MRPSGWALAAPPGLPSRTPLRLSRSVVGGAEERTPAVPFFFPTHLQGVTRTSPVVARCDHGHVRGAENVWVGGHCGWKAIATATLTEPPPAGRRDAGCSSRGSSFDLQLLPLAGLPGKWLFFPRSKGTCFCLAWIRVPAFFPSWHLGSCPLVLKLPFLYPRLGQSRGKNRGSSCSSKTCPSRGH